RRCARRSRCPYLHTEQRGTCACPGAGYLVGMEPDQRTLEARLRACGFEVDYAGQWQRGLLSVRIVAPDCAMCRGVDILGNPEPEVFRSFGAAAEWATREAAALDQRILLALPRK